MEPIVVNIQANTKKEYWDDVPKVVQVFKTDFELITFAYRLALQLDCEVKVTSVKGNKGGDYRFFNPYEADNFLSNN